MLSMMAFCSQMPGRSTSEHPQGHTGFSESTDRASRVRSWDGSDSRAVEKHIQRHQQLRPRGATRSG